MAGTTHLPDYAKYPNLKAVVDRVSESFAVPVGGGGAGSFSGGALSFSRGPVDEDDGDDEGFGTDLRGGAGGGTSGVSDDHTDAQIAARRSLAPPRHGLKPQGLAARASKKSRGTEKDPSSF